MVPPFCHIRVKDGHFASPKWGVGSVVAGRHYTQIAGTNRNRIARGRLTARVGEEEWGEEIMLHARPPVPHLIPSPPPGARILCRFFLPTHIADVRHANSGCVLCAWWIKRGWGLVALPL